MSPHLNNMSNLNLKLEKKKNYNNTSFLSILVNHKHDICRLVHIMNWLRWKIGINYSMT